MSDAGSGNGYWLERANSAIINGEFNDFGVEVMTAENKSLSTHILRSCGVFRWAAVTGLLMSSACVWAQAESAAKLADASHVGISINELPFGKSIFGSYLAGRFAENHQDLAVAAKLMARVLEDDPEQDRLMRRAFILYLGAGRVERAIELAERMEARKKGTTVSLLLLAARDVKASEFATARERFKDVPAQGLARYSQPLATAWISAGLKEFPAAFTRLEPLAKENGFAVLSDLHLALLNENAGRKDEALAIYRKASDDMRKVPLRMVRALGSFLEREGNAGEAKTLYEAYLTVHPASRLIEYELKRLEMGKVALPIAIDAASGFAEGMFNLASALPINRAGAAALLYARIAAYLKPDFPVVQLLMGDIIGISRRYGDSITIYRTIALDSPYSWLARLKMAESLNNAGRVNEAEALLEVLAKERPTDIEPLLRLGSYLRGREEFAGAEEAYNRAVARLGDIKPNNWSLYYYRGISRERLKKWNEAEKDFLKALELSPNQPDVLNYLGYSWVDQGKNLTRARRMIERAVEQRSDDGYIVDSMGWVLYNLGDYSDAVQHLERAVQLRPLDSTISDHLGDAYWRVGRKHEAHFQWRRALSLQPKKSEVIRIESKIQKGPETATKMDSGG
jgi:Flp pilus assembly protein TadD